jgi:hypothetical protein
MNFGEAPDDYRRFIERAGVACLKVCPRDANGVYNFGGAGTYHGAMMAKAKIRVVEVSKQPYARFCRTICAPSLQHRSLAQ